MGGTFSLSPAAVAAFVLFIGTLIFVHELGHFVAAKFFGIKVLKFSLGFGQPLFKFTKGETIYQVAWLPIGGFVKMLGDQPGEEVSPHERHRSFDSVPVHQRALVALAGPIFNLVFPVICFFAYDLLGPTVVSPVVGQIEAGAPAEAAGFEPGDRIVAVDGNRVWDFDRLVTLVSSRAGEVTKFVVDRDGEKRTLEVQPRAVQEEDIFGGVETRGKIGIAPPRLGTRVGVDQPKGRELGFRTGDQILKLADQRPADLGTLASEIRRHRGQTVRVSLVRPHPTRSGGLLLAQSEEPVDLEITIPGDATGLESLGLAPSDTFVRALEPEGAAFRAGLRAGDRVLAVDGRAMTMSYSVLMALSEAKAEPVKVLVRRDGRDFALTIEAKKVDVENQVTGKSQAYYDSGLGLGEVPRSQRSIFWQAGGRVRTEIVELSIGEAMGEAVRQTGAVIVSIVESVYRLLSLQISAKNVGGPLMLFQVAAQAAEMGILTYLQWLALISVNLGVVNLLPIPIFDGGHLLFCLIEAIKRRPVSPRTRELATLVGLAVIAMLIILVFVNDVTRLQSALE
ncbi:MAG: RIP metalloprotease RseP [Deltaproteobacteria bacterium]|nr:RIP metalloprotease RseP [Deltaproteobacteria bacterium]